MLTIWFMYNSHIFARVHLGARDAIIDQVKRLFQEDGCGSLFAKDAYGGTLERLTRHGRQLTGGWGLPASEIGAWADAVLAEASFQKAMVA